MKTDVHTTVRDWPKCGQNSAANDIQRALLLLGGSISSYAFRMDILQVRLERLHGIQLVLVMPSCYSRLLKLYQPQSNVTACLIINFVELVPKLLYSDSHFEG